MYDELVTNQINALQPPYREYVLSDMPGIIAEEFGRGYQFDEVRTGVLGNAIILLLTFLLNREQFVEFVTSECGLTTAEATDLSWGVITSLPEDIRELYLATVATLTQTTAAAPLDLNSEINQAESVLNTIRTMPPTPDETVYTSTQSAILSEGAATLPTADPSAPRWDSSR